jgi:hypothetical protein
MSCEGFKPAQQLGRSGLSKIAQRQSSVNCTHLTPAGLPAGIPGIVAEIDGEMQHAPQ